MTEERTASYYGEEKNRCPKIPKCPRYVDFREVLDRKDELHFPLLHEKRDFLDAVKTRGQTLEDAEVGHRTSTLGHLGHIAIQLGRKLKFDPDKERFIGDDEANKMLALPPGRSPWAV